jgi:DNA-binding GntR family transcriptional regulator
MARKAAESATPKEVAELRNMIKSMRKLLDAGDLVAMSESNSRLHAMILSIGRHATVERLVSALNSHLVRFQYRTILLLGRPERSFAEHSAIVEAVASGDGDAAEAAMRRHLLHLTEALRSAAASSGRPVTR